MIISVFPQFIAQRRGDHKGHGAVVRNLYSRNVKQKPQSHVLVYGVLALQQKLRAVDPVIAHADQHRSAG